MRKKIEIFHAEIKPLLDKLLVSCKKNGVEVLVSVVLSDTNQHVRAVLADESLSICSMHSKIYNIFEQEDLSNRSDSAVAEDFISDINTKH